MLKKIGWIALCAFLIIGLACFFFLRIRHIENLEVFEAPQEVASLVDLFNAQFSHLLTTIGLLISIFGIGAPIIIGYFQDKKNEREEKQLIDLRDAIQRQKDEVARDWKEKEQELNSRFASMANEIKHSLNDYAMQLQSTIQISLLQHIGALTMIADNSQDEEGKIIPTLTASLASFSVNMQESVAQLVKAKSILESKGFHWKHASVRNEAVRILTIYLFMITQYKMNKQGQEMLQDDVRRIYEIVSELNALLAKIPDRP